MAGGRSRAGSGTTTSKDVAGSLGDKLKALQVDAFKRADAFTSQYPQLEALLKTAEDKTKVPAPAVFLGGSSLLILILILFLSFNGVAMLAGFLYPAVSTFKAIQSADTAAQKDLTAYWVLYNLVHTAEAVPLLTWLPFYPIIKLFFFIWASSPRTKGSRLIYRTLIRVFVLPQLGIATVDDTTTTKKSTSNGSSKGGVQPVYSLKVDIAAHDLPMLEDDFLMPQCFVRVIPPTTRPKAEGEETRWKTQAGKSNSSSQEWKDHITAINLSTLDDNTLEIEVRNNGTYSDRFLGVVTFPLKQLGGSRDYKAVYPLQDPQGSIKGGASGELEVSITVSKTTTN